VLIACVTGMQWEMRGRQGSYKSQIKEYGSLLIKLRVFDSFLKLFPIPNPSEERSLMKNHATRFCLIIFILMIATSAFGFGKSDILIQRYRGAHDAADLEALKQLVFWEGATESTIELITARLQEGIKLPIKEVIFRPLKESMSFDTQGYKTNLEPIGRLAITLEDRSAEKKLVSKTFMVGEKDGQFLITVARPLTNAVCPRPLEDVEGQH
jgi:hypothetical protein